MTSCGSMVVYSENVIRFTNGIRTVHGNLLFFAFLFFLLSINGEVYFQCRMSDNARHYPKSRAQGPAIRITGLGLGLMSFYSSKFEWL